MLAIVAKVNRPPSLDRSLGRTPLMAELADFRARHARARLEAIGYELNRCVFKAKCIGAFVGLMKIQKQ